ncbi:MAG: HNH endonuclease, partial [SAR324 cluster bacterium]|nr:HNH endonuclease [SAR324 cluster bacterium]
KKGKITVRIDISELSKTDNSIQDLEFLESTYKDLIPTEKQKVILSRIGQGIFRKNLIDYWGKCCVTGCMNFTLLKASHIKPWRCADNQERLDTFNGLLLIPNLDTTFDIGIISFNEDGNIIVSSKLDIQDRKILGLSVDFRINGLTETHKNYMEYHRDIMFDG